MIMQTICCVLTPRPVGGTLRHRSRPEQMALERRTAGRPGSRGGSRARHRPATDVCVRAREYRDAFEIQRVRGPGVSTARRELETEHLTTRLNCAHDLRRRRSATAVEAVNTRWNAVDGQGAVSAVRLGAWRTLLVDSRRLGGCDRRPRPVAEWARVCETTRFRWEAILPDIRHRRPRWGDRTERRAACV